jgi:hypothetical protein
MRPMKATVWLKSMPLRVQLGLIGLGYAAVLAYGILAEFARYLAAMKDPVSASGGMWAFGDELLAWSIFFCFMVPTLFLILLMREYEGTFVKYSKVLFWFSLSAPLCLGIFVLGAVAHAQHFVDPLVWRTWRAPFALVIIAASRVLARYDAAKRLLSRALLIEGGSLAISLAMLFFPGP